MKPILYKTLHEDTGVLVHLVEEARVTRPVSARAPLQVDNEDSRIVLVDVRREVVPGVSIGVA